ncbi:hypothetical protein U1Q18_052828 [Sarracenia purpurea var. burkii]
MASLFKKRRNLGRRKFRNSMGQSSRDPQPMEKKDEIMCYNYHKPEHIKPEFPLLNKNKKEEKKKRCPKKALKVTWDDTDSSEGEEESSDGELVNLCLMADDSGQQFQIIVTMMMNVHLLRNLKKPLRIL